MKVQAEVKLQGKVIVELTSKGEFIALFPNGDITADESKVKILAKIKTWFKKNLAKDHIGVGSIEWRN